jgi:Uma2 family endonuclease
MVAVYGRTDEVPELGDIIELRRFRGLDTYDEWWDGVYRIVTGPSPEHGELLDALAELLGPLVRAAGLRSAAPVNIGLDKHDCRVPDRAIYESGTPRTSPAFLSTALLVIEVLSPGEKPREKLHFYQAHGVKEYLEIDLERVSAQLWTCLRDVAVWTDAWESVAVSEVLPGLEITYDRWIGTPAGKLDVKDFRPDGS